MFTSDYICNNTYIYMYMYIWFIYDYIQYKQLYIYLSYNYIIICIISHVHSSKNVSASKLVHHRVVGPWASQLLGGWLQPYACNIHVCIHIYIQLCTNTSNTYIIFLICVCMYIYMCVSYRPVVLYAFCSNFKHVGWKWTKSSRHQSRCHFFFATPSISLLVSIIWLMSSTPVKKSI